MDWLWVGLGSALGGMGRYWLAGWVSRWFAPGPGSENWLSVLPGAQAGTLFVNVLGSFAIGFLAAWIEGPARLLAHPDVTRFLFAGVLGGFTTFSAFSLQTLELARGGQWVLAALNIAASIALCMLAVWFGHLLGQAMAGSV